MQVMPGGADDTMDYAMRDIPFMDDHMQKPLPENSPGELYEDSDEQADTYEGCRGSDDYDSDADSDSDGSENDYLHSVGEEGEIA
jgi:hypothetical protein